MMYEIEMDYIAQEVRTKLGEDANSPLDVFALVQQIPKITLVRVNLGDNIAGMTLKNDKVNVIAINSAFSLGRQRFSLAHELYHLWYDDAKRSISIAEYDSKSAIEKKANAFAAYFLVPYIALKRKITEVSENTPLTLEKVIQLEQFFGISHSAMIWRLFNDGYIDEKQREEFLGIPVIQFARFLGYDVSLYQVPQQQQNRTYGYYIDQTNRLYEKKIISQGKYEELLLDAFRDDIVYGVDEEDTDGKNIL